MIYEDDYKAVTQALDALYRDAIDTVSRLRTTRGVVEQLSQFVSIVATAQSDVDTEASRLVDPKAQHLLRKIRAIQQAASGFQELASRLALILNNWQVAIFNGTPTNGTFRQCVAVEVKGADYECSGVVVASKWIITSTHCSKPSKIFIGDDIADAVFGLNEFEVVDRGIATGAVGSVRVAEVIGTIPDPEIAIVADKCAFESVDATIIGFGLDSVAGVYGIKRSGTVEIIKWDPDIVTKPKPNDVCAGDSGGPLVVAKNGIDVVAGLIEESLRVNCGSGAVYTKLEPKLIEAIEKITKVALKVCVP